MTSIVSHIHHNFPTSFHFNNEQGSNLIMAGGWDSRVTIQMKIILFTDGIPCNVGEDSYSQLLVLK